MCVSELISTRTHTCGFFAYYTTVREKSVWLGDAADLQHLWISARGVGSGGQARENLCRGVGEVVRMHGFGADIYYKIIFVVEETISNALILHAISR